MRPSRRRPCRHRHPAPGFQWGDFGIGVAAAFGLICLVAVSIRLLTAHKSRKQPGSVATA